MGVTISEYLRPRSVREASALLAANGRDAVAVGGGVSVVLSGSPRPISAVDLSGLGLDRIERRGDRLRVGAMVTLQSLIRSADAAAAWGGLLPEACRTAATTPVRDLITVGGNVAQCYYWSTLPPLLLALDARIAISGPDKSRVLRAERFLSVHPRKILAAGELVTRVDLPLALPVPRGRKPRGRARSGAAFLKFAKTHNDYALVNACAALAARNGVVESVRLAVGALDTLPQRCREAEAELTGKPFDETLAKDVCAAAVRQATTRQDIRASLGYRRQIAAVTLFRTLSLAWSRATETS